MKQPVLILSDLHLGHAASRIESVDAFRGLLDGAGTVVFNGDTFQELARAFRERSQVLLDELKALCAEMRIETVFLPGNHDPNMDGPGWVELADGRIVVTHGDSVMWGGSPWSREFFERSSEVKELWQTHPRADGQPAARVRLARKMALMLKPPSVRMGKSFLNRLVDAVSPPRRAVEILRVWWAQADEAAEFLKTYFPKADVLIVGHFHRKGVWVRDDRLIINTGAYLNPHGAMWVDYDEGLLRAGPVIEGRLGLSKGAPTGVWRVVG